MSAAAAAAAAADDDDGDEDDDEHFHSLRIRFYKAIYIIDYLHL